MEPAAGSSRHFTPVLAALALAAGAAAAFFVWQPGIASLYDDSVAYLVMAQAMSPWSPAADAVREAFPLEKYPPLFPFALAVTGGAHDWRVAHLFVAACFAASVYLLGRLARAVTGSPVAGLASAATFALLPGAWLNLKGILSEFPYIAASLGTLLAYRALRARGASSGKWALLGLLMTIALLTRTVGIALVGAVAACEGLLWLRERDNARLRGAALALAMPLLAALAWYALRPAGGSDTYVESSAGMLRGTLDHGPAWLLASIGTNLAALWISWLTTWLVAWSSWWRPDIAIAALLAAVGCVGTAWRALEREADALYVVIFVAILLVWPFPGHLYRLMLPVVPLVAVAGWWAVLRVAERLGGARGRAPAAVASVAPLILCLPAMLFHVVARANAPDVLAGPYRRSHVAEFYRIASAPLAASVATRELGVFLDMDHIRVTTPPETRVMWYLPDYVALLAQRRAASIPETDDARAFAAEVRRSGAAYVYLTAIGLRDEHTRSADPLAPARLAAAYTDVVWARQDSAGKNESMLLRVDAARLAKLD